MCQTSLSLCDFTAKGRCFTLPNLCFFSFSYTSSQNKVATRVAACTFNIESAVYDATKKEWVGTCTSTRKHAVYDTYKKRGALTLTTKKDSGLGPVVLCLIKNQKLSLPRHRWTTCPLPLLWNSQNIYLRCVLMDTSMHGLKDGDRWKDRRMGRQMDRWMYRRK